MRVVPHLVFGDVLPKWTGNKGFDMDEHIDPDVCFDGLLHGGHILYEASTATELIRYDNSYEEIVQLPKTMDTETRIYLQQVVDLLRANGTFECEFVFNPKWMIYTRYQ
jgi:hypothetical protein